MLLMDRITELTSRVRKLVAPDVSLSTAVRFRLDEKAQAFVDSIAMDGKRLRLQARYLFWPGPNVWFEWHHPGMGAFGVRFVGAHDDIHVGTMNLWYWPREAKLPVIGLARVDLMHRVPIDIRMINTATPDILATAATARSWLTSPPADTEPNDHTLTASTILAILSLMNSPRLIRTVDISRVRLNSQRLRGGKFPLLAYSEVSVDLGKHDLTALRLDTDGTRRALHWVRAHLRFRMGQWEIVKPHWRGDPSIGIKRPAYRLTATKQ